MGGHMALIQEMLQGCDADDMPLLATTLSPTWCVRSYLFIEIDVGQELQTQSQFYLENNDKKQPR